MVKKPNLMKGEEIVVEHIYTTFPQEKGIYLTNKRMLYHEKDFFSNKLKEMNHMDFKEIDEETTKPFLKWGIGLGIFFLFVSAVSFFFFILGISLIVLAFWYQLTHLKVTRLNNEIIYIPRAKKESAKKIAEEIRNIIYQ